MKLILLSLSTLLTLASEIIPNYPLQVCDNNVCVSKSLGSNGYDYINITTSLIPLNQNFKAHLLLNGEEIANATMTIQSRSGLPFTQVEVSKEQSGSIEIYFKNQFGTYISDYGRNFHFSL